MVQQAVTELIVRGDGAIATLDRFEDKMEAAGAATDRSTGAVDAYRAAMAKASAAQEKGLAVTTQSVERMSREQRQWENLGASVNKISALEIRQRREAANAAVIASNAVLLGYADQEQAIARLAALERKHTDQMRAITNVANDNVSASVALAARTEELRMRYDATYASAAKMDAELNELAEAERLGIQITGGYSAALDRLIQKYDAAAAAALSAANAQREFITNARASQDAENARQIAAANQNHFNAVLGVNATSAGSARESAAAFEAAARAADEEAAALERLRAKVVPLYAASKQYEAELLELNSALSAGVVSADQHAVALGALNARYEQAGRASVASAVGFGKVAGAAKLTSNQMLNLSRQGNDVITMFALGAPPMQIFASQAGQIYDALEQGPGGIKGSLKAIGEGALSLATRFPLVTAAIAAAGAAFVAYQALGGSGIRDLDEILAEHEANIKRLGDAYDEVNGKRAKYASATANTINALNESALKDAQNLIAVQIGAVFDQVYKQIGAGSGNQGPLRTVMVSQFEPFSDALKRLAEESHKAVPDLAAVAHEITDIARADPKGLNRTRDALLKMLNPAMETAAAMPELGKSIDDVVDTVDQFNRQIDDVSAKPIRDELQKIFDKAREGKEPLEQIILQLAKLEQANPSFQGIIDGFRGLIKEAYDASVALDTLRPGGSGSPNGRGKLPVGILPEFAPVPELRPSAEDALAKSTKKATDAYDRLIDAAQRRLDQMQTELGLVGKAGAAVEAYRMEQDLLSRAKEREIDLTPKQEAEIHKLAQAYGEVAQAAEEARVKSDLVFERDQIGRTDTEQRVAEAMRHLYGDDYQSHMNGAIAGQIRYNEELAKTDDLAQEAFGAIIDALTSSGDLADNLISAFAQIGKMFAQIGQQKFFDYITGKSSSLFGLPSLSNVGGNSVANASNFGREAGKVMAGPISEKFATAGTDLASVITSAANTLGISARDLATVISYESGFRTDAVNPDGKHIGLIQFGPEEQRKYGVAIGQALTDQMQAVVAYLKDRGLKPGMDLLDLYSTINAGSPGRYNAVDGTTTVSQKVAGMAAHQSAADRILGKQAVSDGMMDYTRRIQSTGSMGDTFDTSAPTSVAGMSKMQGLMGVGGAGLGAFFGGMQSGDPLSGALGGAMAGLGAVESLGALGFGAMATPIGLIGGAVLGLIGGLIGKAKQKKQELKQAQQELESQIGAITNLIRTTTGNFLGTFEKSFNDTSDEYQKAIALAEKAKNAKLVQELKESRDKFFDKLISDWNSSFQGTLDSLNAGLGMDGEFLKGADAVDKMKESLVGFVNDAKFFAEANGDLSKMLDARKAAMGIGTTQRAMYQYQPEYHTGGKEGSDIKNELVDGYLDLGNQVIKLGVQAFTAQGGQLYKTLQELKDAAIAAGLAIDDQGKVTVAVKEATADYTDTVQKAIDAARASALATLSGGKVFTEIEQAIQRLQGAAASLPELLEDLGMSAEEAAKAIEHHLNIALRDLRNNLTTDLTRSINDLAGFGYLNDLLDAQTAYESRVRDLQALGMDTGLAMQELGLRLANIAKEAELTDDQLTQLAAVFPQLGGSLMGLIGAGSTGTTAAVADAKAKLDDAKADLRRAYEEEASRLNQVISKHEAYIKSLQKFKDDLKLDSNLSPYDPYQRLQEAQRQFQETATAALGGDEDALGRIEDVSRSYLEEARSYYGTSEAYFSIFNDVQSLLDQALAVSNSSLSEAQQQLAALKDLVSPLIDINDSVMSVADAIAALTAAEAANAAAIAARDAQQAQLFQQMLGLLQQTGQAYDPFVSSLYRDVLGRAPDAEGAAYYTNMLNSGMSQDAVRAQFIANAQPELARGYPLFAEGGFHAGGYRIVGERGPELEATGPSRIWSASDTSRILSQAWQAQSYGASNDNGNGELLREVKALREQNAKLLERLISVSATGAQATTAAARETSLAVREQTKAARLERRQKVA